MSRNNGAFYGWRIVFAIFFVWFGYAASPFAVILKQLMVEFHCGRGEVCLIPAISSITGGVSAFLVSRLLHRRSPRKFMFVGLVGSGLVQLLCGLAVNLWHLYVMYFCFGIFFGASGAVTAMSLLSRWFIRKRGLAVGLALSGFSFGSVVVVPLVGFVAHACGWRATCVLAGLLILGIGVPLMWFVVKDSPHEMGLLPDGDEGGEEQDSIASQPADSPSHRYRTHAGLTTCLTQLPLWLIGLSFPLAVTGTVAITQHMFSFVTDIGIPATVAASAFGLTMGVGGAGGFIAGWMTDRVSTRYVSILALFMSIAGVLLLMQVRSIASLWLFVVVFGLASGVPAVLLPLVIGDIFGSAGLSVIFGFLNVPFTFGFALGPPLAGFVFDATGSYSRVFLVVIALYILAAIGIYFAYGRRPGLAGGLKSLAGSTDVSVEPAA